MRIENHRLIDSAGHAVPFLPTPNLSKGTVKAHFLVVHYTAGRSLDSTCAWLRNREAKASAHLVIGRDRRIVQLAPFDRVAQHAGTSLYDWHGTELTHLNRFSIGIELDNAGRLLRRADGLGWQSPVTHMVYPPDQVLEATHALEKHPAGWHLYPPEQLELLEEIALALVKEYGLTEVLGHEDVAYPRGRKLDPGPAFPLEALRSRLFGRANGDGEGDGDETEDGTS